MKILITSFLLLTSSLNAFAAFNEKLNIKQVAPDGVTFVFFRKEGPAPWKGITVKDPQTKAILYDVKVLKCSASTCLGQVLKNYSGIKLRTDEEYFHSYNEVATQVGEKDLPPPDEPKPKSEPKIEPEPQPVPMTKSKDRPKEEVSLYERSIYLSYGSPLGPGIKLGYFQKFGDYFVGANYANISSTTNNVNVKGHLLSGVASYTVFKLSHSIDINAVGELGLAKTILDFGAVDPSDGPSIDETTYFIGAAGEAVMNFDRFAFAIKSGMSKAGFSETYDGRTNKYSNPYGTILVFLEIGAYYRF